MKSVSLYLKGLAFLNDQTFEVAVANTTGLKEALLDILDEQGFGVLRSSRIASWRAGIVPDPTQLLAMISDIGKGRLAAKLEAKSTWACAAGVYCFSYSICGVECLTAAHFQRL